MLPSGAPDRADYHLLFIAVALVGGFAIGLLSPLSIGVGVAGGSLLASVAVVDSVVLNPPTED